MGREIRMVPPNWAHPKKQVPDYRSGRTVERYQPLYETTFVEAAAEWRKDFEEFYAKGDNLEHEMEYWEWHGPPPDRDYYITYTKDQATWYQLFETVSEGTPVSPPFATKEELADYLAENGDFWDQERRKDGVTSMECKPWGKEVAYKFVMGSGWAPSFIVQGGKIISGVEAMVKNE